MKHNVITFASVLANNLSENILSKFQESVEDKLNQLSQKYNKTITILGVEDKYLVSHFAQRYSDGTLKTQLNDWDILTKDEQEEVLNLIKIQDEYKEDSKKVMKYLIPLAFKTQEINNRHEVISSDEDSYVLFFKCLPDFIINDKTLLTKGSKLFSGLSEEDVYSIMNHKVDSAKVDSFKEKHCNPEVTEILEKLYALDFLMDY